MTAPLFDGDAEQAVLAALLADAESCATAVRHEVEADSFFHDGHRRLFRAMLALYDAGDRVDPMTVKHKLEAERELEAAGGLDYIGFLVGAVPTSANAAHHARIVREYSDRRAGVTIAKRLEASFVDRSIAVQEAAGEAGAELARLIAHRAGVGFRPIKEALWNALQEIEDRHRGDDSRSIRFGFRDIDRGTSGVQRGEFVLLVGAPMHGKTAFALNVADYVASNGVGVGFVSAEMSATALANRLLSRRGQVDGRKLRDPKLLQPDDFPRLANAAGPLASLPIHIYDATRPTVRAVEAQCRGLKARHPGTGLIIVDVLQLIEAEMSESRALELDRIAYALKGMAKELDVVVAATVHADGRKLEERPDHRPRLSDIAWSQAPEKACDIAIALWREALYDPTGLTADVLKWAILKGRDVGRCDGILRWTGAYMLVEDTLI